MAGSGTRRRARARGRIEKLPSGSLRVSVYAHALGHVRGIKDTSRQGRWHNAKFKALAEELGIEVTKDERTGWSPTTLPEQNRQQYAAVLAELGRVLVLFPAVGISGGGEKTKATPPVVCGCGRKIRVGKTVLAAGPIVWRVCGTEFAPDGDEDKLSETGGAES